MKKRRPPFVKLGVCLVLGAIVNVAVAIGFGTCAEWPGLGRMELRGTPIGDSDLQPLWSRFGDPHQAEGLRKTGPEIDRQPRWILRGWSLEESGYTIKALGNGYVPMNNSPNGGWRGDADAVCIAIAEFGSPLRCMSGKHIAIGDPRPLFARISGKNVWFRGIQPLWPGFAINTIFYAAILWMLFAFPFALRRRRRIKRGLCPACAYPIGVSPVCTECGKPVTLRSTPSPSGRGLG